MRCDESILSLKRSSLWAFLPALQPLGLLEGHAWLPFPSLPCLVLSSFHKLDFPCTFQLALLQRRECPASVHVLSEAAAGMVFDVAASPALLTVLALL